MGMNAFVSRRNGDRFEVRYPSYQSCRKPSERDEVVMDFGDCGVFIDRLPPAEVVKLAVALLALVDTDQARDAASILVDPTAAIADALPAVGTVVNYLGSASGKIVAYDKHGAAVIIDSDTGGQYVVDPKYTKPLS